MHRERDVLVVRVGGFHTPGPVSTIIGSVQAELARQGLKRLLLDLRMLTGIVTAADHVEDARQMVGQLGGIRWATVVRREQYSGAGHAYCIEQGCDTDVFFDEEPAMAWLRSGDGGQ